MRPRDEYADPDFGDPGPDSASPSDGDAVEHLWNAAHEMLRAMRTLIDAADEFVEVQRGERSPARRRAESREARVHHIDIDVRPDSRSSGAS